MKELCKNCDGKGYATQWRGFHGSEDFDGDGFDTEKKVEISFCKCQRGKDLEKLIERKEIEAMRKYRNTINKSEYNNTDISLIKKINEDLYFN